MWNLEDDVRVGSRLATLVGKARRSNLPSPHHLLLRYRPCSRAEMRLIIL